MTAFLLTSMSAAVASHTAQDSAASTAGRKYSLTTLRPSCSLSSKRNRSLRVSSRRGSAHRSDNRNARLQCNAVGSLSIYSRPVERSAAWHLPSWFEPCLRSVVANLSRAPLLQAVYDSRGHLSVGTQFVTHAVSEELVADPKGWEDLALTSGDRAPKALIFVREVQSRDVCAMTGGRRECERECASQGGDPLVETLVREGSIGDCDTLEEEEECSGQPSMQSSVTKYWGMVMQSPDGGPSGCFLLKTTQNIGGSCSCTHFSLTRICHGVPLAQQFVDSWRV